MILQQQPSLGNRNTLELVEREKDLPPTEQGKQERTRRSLNPQRICLG